MDQVLSFNYNGGTHPGSRRIVLAYDSRCLTDRPCNWQGSKHCLDLESGDWRTFTPSKISNLKVEDSKIINISSLPSGFSIKELEKSFQEEGRVVHIHGNTLVAYVPSKSISKPLRNWDRLGGLVVEKGDRVLHLATSFHNQAQFLLCVYEKNKSQRYLESQNSTAEQLQKALNWVLE